MKEALWAILVVFIIAVLMLDVNGCSSRKKITQDTMPTQEPIKTQPAVFKEDRSVQKSPAITEETKTEEPRFVTIYFDFDKSGIRQDQQNSMNNNAQLLSRNNNVKILLEGHCDERGTDEYNMALGQRRCDTVKTYLMDYGIDGTRIKTISYGEERPAENGHNESSWSKNRRGEFKIVN